MPTNPLKTEYTTPITTAKEAFALIEAQLAFIVKNAPEMDRHTYELLQLANFAGDAARHDFGC